MKFYGMAFSPVFFVFGQPDVYHIARHSTFHKNHFTFLPRQAFAFGRVIFNQQVFGGETFRVVNVAYLQKLLDDRVEFRSTLGIHERLPLLINFATSRDAVDEVARRYEDATGRVPFLVEGSSPGAGAFGHLRLVPDDRREATS